MGRNLMRRICTICLVAAGLVSLDFFRFGAMVKAQELLDPMQPPPFALLKFNQAKSNAQRVASKPVVAKPPQKSLQLTSILFSQERKIAIIDDRMLTVGDRIRGAELVKLTRASARLVRKGKVINLSLGHDLSTIKKQAVETDL